MHGDELRQILRQTLSDMRLSRGERSALAAWLKQNDPAADELAQIRNAAFALARDSLADNPPASVLDWLEDVLRATQPAAASASVCEVHFSPGDDCPRRLASLFEQAREAADVCVFTITDDRVTSAILAAHKRGIKLRVVTDNEKAFDLGSDIPLLQKSGVPVRVDCTPFHMHHKFALFDRKLLVTGSYNWTRGAAESNQENFIISGDRRLLEPFSQVFERLWEQFR